jgi:hypothetical protein
MKSLLPIALMLLMTASSIPQKNHEDLGLPELHKIKRITLSPSYSCRSAADFAKGYANTALFLSTFARQHNSPELLFDGGLCNETDYFVAANAGADLGVIADFGEIRIEDLTADDVFGRLRSADSAVQFREMIKTQTGHTYCALINKDTTRGFFYFRVVGYIPNQKVDLEYVVMDYTITRQEGRSPGFDWTKKSFY